MADNKIVFPERYVTRYDPTEDIWQVVDMWNEDIQKLSEIDPDTEVPWDHKASICLNGLQTRSLAREMDRLEVLKNIVRPSNFADKKESEETLKGLSSMVVNYEPGLGGNSQEILSKIVNGLTNIGVVLAQNISPK